MSRRAVFLDRDGTLVHPEHYPSSAAQLRVYEGLGPHMRRLVEAGVGFVVITNQSGVARGLFGVAELEAMHAWLARELAALGVELSGVYYCPHHPEGSVPGYAVECECRKPKPGLLLRAARELDLDLGRSWFVGDILDDVEAGNRAGCGTVLVDLGTEPEPDSQVRTPDYVARDTVHALAILACVEGLAERAELDYRPAGWRPARELTSGGAYARSD